MLRPNPPAEVVVDARLVRRLLRAQHPDLADLPLRRLGSGWDTEVFRLGRELVVRVPRRELGARLLAAELLWLPALAPGLPLPVPEPVREGRPGPDLRWPWSVCAYVPGRPVGAAPLSGGHGQVAAAQLAGFLGALHRPAPADAPRSTYRGVPLQHRTDAAVEAMAVLDAATRARAEASWGRACQRPAHAGPDLWLHGDLHGLNVLARRGRITGIIDFGDLCAGDPATDLACAWLLLDAPARHAMREALRVDEDRWERGRGWALYLGLMFLRHSEGSPVSAAIGERAVREVLG